MSLCRDVTNAFNSFSVLSLAKREQSRAAIGGAALGISAIAFQFIAIVGKGNLVRNSSINSNIKFKEPLINYR